MKNSTLTIAASLVSLAGLLLVADAAWAQAKKTPIEGAWYGCFSRPERERREWVDEDGIRHVRNDKFVCLHTGDIVGREVGWESWDQKDPAGTGATGRGFTYFFGEVLGEPVEAVIRYTFDCTRIDGVQICTSEFVWHLDDGSLIKLSSVDSWEDPPVRYTGILLDPPGRK